MAEQRVSEKGCADRRLFVIRDFKRTSGRADDEIADDGDDQKEDRKDQCSRNALSGHIGPMEDDSGRLGRCGNNANKPKKRAESGAV